MVAVAEDVGEDGADGDGEIVGDGVVEGGAGVFGGDGVAVAPGGEGASELDVAEALVPAEIFDLGFPWDSEWGEREWAVADGEAGAVTGSDAGVSRRVWGTWGWWGEDGFFNASALPMRHEAWEIFGVCEEGEDQLWRVGKPLRGFEVVGHEFWWWAKIARKF